MERFFNMDNGLMRALSKLFDMGLLSLIYLVFCIPIVTIGAATTSLYYVSAKVLRHNRSYVWKEFWSCFKTNFKQATILWVIVGGAMAYFAWVVSWRQFNTYLTGVYLAFILIIFLITLYVFPILSRFTMKVTHVLRLSLYCAFRHIGYTLIMLVIVAVAALGLVYGFYLWIIFAPMFIPGVAGFLYTFPMERVMKKYMPKEDKQYTEEGEEIVAWYNE